MEEYRPYVVQMAIQCEHATTSLVVPDLDLVVVTSGNEEGLCRVEVNATNGAIMFFEAINESSHAVIP
ncbi:phospholipid-transporting ATPase [Aspergillus luchuensis]|uniref:Phospholipid-transporting ATPase n=1 Tax=Aspergillus kawachii TaxID=1069201 RepID=A0A146FE92_ASPKA|nr:phospholipid-transporting ATPase [Aspergillus luchuensis]